MHAVRRHALAAILAVLAGLALTGCRTQPGIASYVETAGSQQRGRAVGHHDRQRREERRRHAAEGGVRQHRQLVVQLTVFTRSPGGTPRRRASRWRRRTMRRRRNSSACPSPIRSSSSPSTPTPTALCSSRTLSRRTPTEADLRDAYDRIVATGVQEISFEQIKDQLAALRSAQRGRPAQRTGRRGRPVRRVGNPRYQPVEMPISGVPGQSG